VRIALVGAGSIADWHLAGLAAAGCPAALVASRGIARARAAAARHGIAEAVEGWEALHARADIHAAVIATPDATHERIAAAFLEAGKPVLVQKPLALSVEAAARLLALARARGVPLEVAFMHRHLPEVVAAGALLRAGAIGRVLSARIRNATPGPDWDPWFWRASDSGGVAAQIGVHGMDLLRHLIAPIASVSAEAATRVPHRRLRDGSTVEVGVPDHVVAAYRLADGEPRRAGDELQRPRRHRPLRHGDPR
jgi:predicted dehydrogenase